MPRPRTPLLRPDRYFEAHDGSPPLAHAAAAVLVVAVVTTAGLSVFLDQFAAALDVPITVDNPDYPGEMFCGDSSPYDDTPSGCDQPKTIERNLGTLVAQELSWLPPVSFVLVPIWWLFQAGVLHGASILVEGTGRFEDTLAVAGWGMAPSLIRIVGVLGFVTATLGSVTVPSNPESAVSALQGALSGLQPVTLGLALVTAVWGGAIRSYGLAEARDLRVSTAAWLVGVLTVIGLVFELF